MSSAGIASLRAWAVVVLTLAAVSQYCSGGRSNGPKQPCKVCKSFVESFEKNFKATANSNFAGGDTSWEEEKLGSYSKSEVRLVEIMEEVCSGSDHDCYHLVSTYEDDIERWWFKLRHKGEGDLLKWLCFKHLDVCCPSGHYGPNCEPCPGGAEQPCGGHGNCKGEEEKNGLGICSCSAGYHGDKCDACSEGYYSEGNLCIACNAVCKTCGGGSSSHCGECADGYVLDDAGVCTDKDECTLDPNLCKEGTYCVNTPGGHNCNACDRSCQGGCSGPGASKCQSCAQGFTLSQDGFCEDKDECVLGESSCSVGTYCKNTPGSHMCAACHSSCLLSCSGPGPEGCVECKPGYTKANETCVDVNECDSAVCDQDTEVCLNLAGSHTCNCRDGLVRQKGKCLPKIRKSKKKKEQTPANAGEQANAGATGEQANAGTTGEQANAGTTGEQANAGTTGEQANAGTTGEQANAGTTGEQANAGTTGEQANAGTTGEQANARTTGEQVNAGTTGEQVNPTQPCDPSVPGCLPLGDPTAHSSSSLHGEL